MRRQNKATGSANGIDAGGSAINSWLFTYNRSLSRVALFVGVFVLLFLLNSRYVNLYDEGIVLTGTMRAMAGQVLYRDFYYIYGPAQVYILAALFKIFGSSVLVERLADVFCASFLVVSVYVLTRRFCSRSVAVGAAVLCVLWLIGTILMQFLLHPTVCVLMLWSAWLILPVADRGTQRRRAFAAGLLAAIAFLFRYDMGLGLLLASLFAALVMAALRDRVSKESVRSVLVTVFGPYLGAFFIVVLPAAIAYLSVAPFHDLLYDIVLYSSKYYHIARNLPFPRGTSPTTFEDLVVYLIPLLIALALWIAIDRIIEQRGEANQQASQAPDWANLLIILSVTAAVMYVKGIVRISAGQMYGSTYPCILIAAILFQHRTRLRPWMQPTFAAMLLLFFATAASATRMKLLNGTHVKPLVLNWILTPGRQPPFPPFRDWCHDNTPVTRGFCFLLDDDHIQAVRYIDDHTRPGDLLYIGLAHHDRIFINDNATYFAAQRLPATKWSHFDPFLQNREDIQREMIAELQRNKPPYVVLDSEFKNAREPNGSSVSTGVHLLDDYIAANYTPVQQYGEMTILKREQ